MVTLRRVWGLITLLALLSIPGGALAQSPGSGDDAADPALAAVELMNMVPAGVMETCVPYAPSLAGQRAVAQCSLGADTVLYASYEDLASLGAAFDDITAGVTVEGDATSCAEGPFEGSYPTADGAAGGMVLCQAGDPALLLAWTDEGNTVLGVLALAEGSDYGVLHERWLSVRLDASASAPASPSVTRAPGGFGAAPAASADVVQWAVEAVASTQYDSDAWSASQATGEPDTTSYGDQATAWAPSASEGGDEWIELTYEAPVVPTTVAIHESSGAGCVIRVEAWDDDAGAWVVLWEGTDPSPDALTVFSPPLDPVTFATDRLRVTIDTAVPGWNEIDAVSLTGTPP